MKKLFLLNVFVILLIGCQKESIAATKNSNFQVELLIKIILKKWWLNIKWW